MNASSQALIYCRVSTGGQEQDGTSLETQEAACRAHAEELGYDVGAVYRETYTGTELFDRPVLNALRDAAKTGRYRAVIVYVLDRLTRGQGLTAYLLAEFERGGCDLLSVMDPLDKTKEGKLIVSIKEYVAEVEREKIRERTMRGKRAKLATGQLCNGSVSLYGYRIDPETRTRVIYQPEAGIVRRIFERAAQGDGVRRTARQLTAEGVPTRGTGKYKTRDGERLRRAPSGNWAHKCVTDILNNPAYKGETVYLGQTLPDGVTPPIVSADLWQAAQQRNPPNGPKPADQTRNEKRPHLLRGLITCAVCGGRMRPGYIASRGDKGQVYPGHVYYQCGSPGTARGRCGSRSVRADLIEPWAWGHVERVLQDPDIIAEELERQRDAGPDQAAQDDVHTANRQLADIERQQKRLLELYAGGEDGLPVDMLKVKLRELEAQVALWQRTRDEAQERLRRQEQSQAELESLTLYCRRVAGNLQTFSFEERRTALEALGVTVRANGREWILRCDLDLAEAHAVPEPLCSQEYQNSMRSASRVAVPRLSLCFRSAPDED